MGEDGNHVASEGRTEYHEEAQGRKVYGHG
jgi:hypothetical protein